MKYRQYNIISFLSDTGVPYRTAGKNTQKGWVNVNCPYCHDDGFHGGFNIESKSLYYTCWKCKWHNPVETLELLTNKKNTYQLLQNYKNTNIIDDTEYIPISRKKQLIPYQICNYQDCIIFFCGQ